MGLAYYFGHGITPDESIAVKHWKKAAAMSNLRAMLALGQVYQNGFKGHSQDRHEAFHWFREALQDADEDDKTLTDEAKQFIGSLERGDLMRDVGKAVFSFFADRMLK